MVQPNAPKNAILWVAGGRDYQNAPRIHYVLDKYHERHGIRLIVTGAATGADMIAEGWARKKGIPYHGRPAKWELGLSAGPKRNEEIADEETPDVLIAFPGGRGTQNAIETARLHNIPVYEITDISPPTDWKGTGLAKT